MIALLLLISGASAVIVGDLNCTTYIGQTPVTFGYSQSATVCSNTIADAACDIIYPPVAAGKYPAPGNDVERPFNCYTITKTSGGAFSADMKTAALNSCPKSCGYCCQTNSYNCKNVQFPRLNCATITPSQCSSVAWRTIIAEDCPSACGFCGQGGCVDAVPDCANDLSICNTVGLQDFVNTYCQKSCQRCQTSTTTTRSTTALCTTYNPNSSAACSAWALNGFCSNPFYTVAQRKKYCATTCKLC
ncbi:Protein CBG10508 [Caenorhabditis briggsae]|uniref:ShKT domain-containing protein n=2 Tax=Caenorhabditis briggsae TaxID=6238 RepID=A0AAE8ZUS1_CAEBR|nr:Protein CBG10508 [Caenorhabditis briggsae]ULT87001.1 hypothetical protein L3Y34_006629 [Caenorhabditis briggsae]CAP29917.2 Protein CBG10508 [Caenorhabditis briggsae]